MKIRNVIITVIISVATTVVVLFLFGDVIKTRESLNIIDESKESPVSFVSNQPRRNIGNNFSLAAESTVHSVVHVKNIMKNTRMNSSNSRLDFFWGSGFYQKPKPVIGSGSGVIITKDGYIVTNNHVIDKAKVLEVTLNNQKKYTAKIIGADPKTDIALLKIDADDLPYISLSNSDNIRLGEWVLAVGNPFNLTSTVTAGIISAIGRDISILGESGIESFIQTDAVVNPGNSGGALVNTNGELIGINTAISTHTGSFEGYSFAIPSNIVKKVVEDLIEYGQVQRAYLGINIHELNADTANKLGVSETEGIYVGGFSESGLAKNSGMEKGDVVYKIDDKKIKSFADLKGYLASKRPGDKVLVYVLRGDDKKEFDVELTNSQGTTELNKYEGYDIISMLNADLEPLSYSQKRRLGIKSGVMVKNIGEGVLKKAGIKNGYIIMKIQNKWIESKEDIDDILSNNDKAVLMEVVDNNGFVDYYAVRLGSAGR